LILAAIPRLEPGRRTVAVPPSKSLTNRALVLAALTQSPGIVRRPLACADTDAIVGALSTMGLSMASVEAGIEILPGPPPKAVPASDVGDSGTACRFLTAFAASRPGLEVVLTGSARLCERPVGPLVEALRQLGADITYARREGYPPLRIRGRELAGGAVELHGDLSSQFASALLLVSPCFRDGLDLTLTGRLVSLSYVELTREMLAACGIVVERRGSRWSVSAGQLLRSFSAEIPGDFSSAIPLAAAALIVGGTLDLPALVLPSAQPDARALAILEEMGGRVETIAGGIRVSGSVFRAVDVDAGDFPDAVPALCAAAAFVGAESRFSGVEHLRLKESDRLAAMSDLLRRAGILARVEPGTLYVGGSARPDPARLPSHGDHRIAMAAALLLSRTGGWIEWPGVVAKSYPAFFRDLFSVPR
jgi:3-phosphoshikimate 1-carboxyvinyltransferase